jgi:HEAT repeat protein
MTFATAMQTVWTIKKPLALAALRILAGDDRYHVRADLAAWIPEPMPDVFEQLAHDPSLSVRQAIAKNVHTPALLLMRLADDKEEIVRYAAAHNIKTPHATLAWLARVDPDGVDQDLSVHVRQRARATLGGRP